VSDVITLLRTRFGNELQVERFRAELRAKWRQPHESVQQLYLDVSKLVAVVYLAATPELSSHVAKEAFIEALNDPQLQLKVVERVPKLVEDALYIATRLEGYEASLFSRNYDRGMADFKAKPKIKATLCSRRRGKTHQLEDGNNLALVRQWLAEVEVGGEEVPDRRYLPSLAISRVPLNGETSMSVKPITKDRHTLSKTPFSRAYVNAKFQGRSLMCMLDTGCD